MNLFNKWLHGLVEFIIIWIHLVKFCLTNLSMFEWTLHVCIAVPRWNTGMRGTIASRPSTNQPPYIKLCTIGLVCNSTGIRGGGKAKATPSCLWCENTEVWVKIGNFTRKSYWNNSGPINRNYFDNRSRFWQQTSWFESVKFNDIWRDPGTTEYVPGVQGKCQHSHQNFLSMKNNITMALYTVHTIQLW